jgi:GNAT superfamily N-acetyltransferase
MRKNIRGDGMAEGLSLKTASGREDIQTIAALAREIWGQHYTPIIGAAQVKYMVDNFQSEKAVEADIASGYVYTVAYREGTPCGYSAIRFDPDVLFLSKLYVLQAFRGKGIAQAMLRAACEAARQYSLTCIRLTCNKYNTGSLSAYARMGFVRTADIVTDIGGGFVMDDYVLEKRLES